MRILAIRGRNLASLSGEFELALDAEPLASVGLFAISGPTGSGKSTLLDALCLALFDSTPRLSQRGGAMVGHAGSEEGDRLRANDVRGLLSRGAGEGYAEVDFVGVSKERFRARWEVHRSRRRANGRLQSQRMSLENLDRGVSVGDKKTEVLAAIQEQLGLDFDQFRRSALLAQGEFAAFLRAEASARAALLERVTGTAIYREISMAAHERYSKEAALLRELHGRLQLLGRLTPDQRTALEAQLAQATDDEASASAEVERLRQQVRWFDERAALASQVEQGEVQLESARLQVEQAEPRRLSLRTLTELQPLREQLERYDAAVERRRVLDDGVARVRREREDNDNLKAEAEIQSTEAHHHLLQVMHRRAQAAPDIEAARLLDAELAQALRLLQDAEDRRGGAHERALAARQTVQEQQEKRDGAEADLHTAEALMQGQDALVALVDRWPALRMQLERLVQEVQRHRALVARQPDIVAAFEQASRRARQLEGATEALEARHEQARAVLAELQRRLPEGGSVALAQRRDALLALRQAANEAEGLCRRVEDATHDRKRLLGRQRAAKRDLGVAQQQVARGRIQRDQVRERLDEARHSLALVRTAMSLDEHRKALVDGEPCPVCGSRSHPWGADHSVAALLGEQQQRIEVLETELADAEARVNDANNAEVRARTQEDEASKRLREVNQRLTDARGKWPELQSRLPVLPLDLFAADVAATVQAERTRLDDEWNAFELAQNQHEQLLSEQEQARQALEQARDSLQQHQRKLDQAGHDETQARTAADNHQEQLADSDQRMLGLREDLAEALAGVPLAASLTSAPDQVLATLDLQVEQLRAALTQRRDATLRIQELDRQLASSTAQLQAADRELGEVQQVLEQRQQAVDRLRAQRGSLLGGRSIADVQAELEEAEQRARRTVERANQAIRSHQEQEARLEERLKASVHSRDEARDALTAAESAVMEALRARDLGLPEARELLRGRDAAWLEEEGSALKALDAALQDAATRLDERRQALQRHDQAAAPDEPAEVVRARLEESQQRLTTATTQRVSARVELDNDDRQASRAADIDAQARAQQVVADRWAALNEVIGSHDGSRFRTFAQGLTLDGLLVYANLHLRDLASRYVLQRVPGEDLELQVMDRDMGDEIRPIPSLSGGESFLVSLALALGLSSMSASDTPVDSLFIDEGFGTLDKESLETALGVLDALQATGRQVGVISHVEGFADQIGVVVEVRKLGAGRSEVRKPRVI